MTNSARALRAASAHAVCGLFAARACATGIATCAARLGYLPKSRTADNDVAVMAPYLLPFALVAVAVCVASESATAWTTALRPIAIDTVIASALCVRQARVAVFTQTFAVLATGATIFVGARIVNALHNLLVVDASGLLRFTLAFDADMAAAVTDLFAATGSGTTNRAASLSLFTSAETRRATAATGRSMG